MQFNYIGATFNSHVFFLLPLDICALGYSGRRATFNLLTRLWVTSQIMDNAGKITNGLLMLGSSISGLFWKAVRVTARDRPPHHQTWCPLNSWLFLAWNIGTCLELKGLLSETCKKGDVILYELYDVAFYWQSSCFWIWFWMWYQKLT